MIPRSLIALLFAIPLLACSQSTTQRVGDHTFHVPKKQLMAKQLYWVPFESDGISFILNPERNLPEQILIGLRTVQGMCPLGLTEGDNPTALLCSKKNIIAPSQTPLSAERLNKQMGDVGNIVWTYGIRDTDGDHPIISCSAGSPDDRKGGFCFALASYRDLIFRIYVREVEISRLPVLVGETQAVLSKWEAAAK